MLESFLINKISRPYNFLAVYYNSSYLWFFVQRNHDYITEPCNWSCVYTVILHLLFSTYKLPSHRHHLWSRSTCTAEKWAHVFGMQTMHKIPHAQPIKLWRLLVAYTWQLHYWWRKQGKYCKPVLQSRKLSLHTAPTSVTLSSPILYAFKKVLTLKTPALWSLLPSLFHFLTQQVTCYQSECL